MIKPRYWWIERKYLADKYRDRLLRAIAWRLPRRLVMWSAYRVIANATTGQWGNQEVPALSAMDAMKRWDPKP